MQRRRLSSPPVWFVTWQPEKRRLIGIWACRDLKGQDHEIGIWACRVDLKGQRHEIGIWACRVDLKGQDHEIGIWAYRDLTGQDNEIGICACIDLKRQSHEIAILAFIYDWIPSISDWPLLCYFCTTKSTELASISCKYQSLSILANSCYFLPKNTHPAGLESIQNPWSDSGLL